MTILSAKNNIKAQRNRRRPEEIDAIVLDILRQANGPLSAYEIAVRTTQLGQVIVPNQVYRTLARLIGEGTARKIKSLSAYIPSSNPADLVIICNDCQSYRLIRSAKIAGCLNGLIALQNFHPTDSLIEMLGICDLCQNPRKDPKGCRSD